LIELRSRISPPHAAVDVTMPNTSMHVNAFQRGNERISLWRWKIAIECGAVNIAELRQEYMRTGLSEAQADANPIKQFERWFEDALQAGVPLANAMTLATVSAAGAPSARIVLLKGIEDGGFVFYTNYRSRKGRELGARAAACLVFLWSALERQVRIDGTVEKVSAGDSDAYYASRPLGARLSAWASQQSEPVENRPVLEAAVETISKKYGEQPPRPPHWGGFRVVPAAIEFWQGRADRLHDRLAYARSPQGAWTIQRLAP
jgi:pyridoxamine 5'-phosphate oxidase